MTVELMNPGPSMWEQTCSRCCATFRYTLGGVKPQTFCRVRVGWGVSCPACQHENDVPDGAGSWLGNPRRAVGEPIAPSYHELLAMVRTLHADAKGAFEIIVERDFGGNEDDEEVQEPRENIEEAAELIARFEKSR